MQLSAPQIAAYALQDPSHPEVELSQVSHRILLVREWGIEPGARILEIGCGQGNCTTVLAKAAGSTGHVDAIDPAPGDYGAPFTLAQAQDHISASPVGSRITWHRADPINFLASSNVTWDYAVLSHCIWYFKSTLTLAEILRQLATRVKKVCIAEYALQASEPHAMPHVLAALTRAAMEAHIRDSTENIQSPLSPAGIKKITGSQGLRLQHESMIVPDAALSDGGWEVGSIVDPDILDRVSEHIADGRVSLLIRSMRDSLLGAVEKIGGVLSARTMDVWVAVFEF